MIQLDTLFPGAELRRRPSSYATSHATEEIDVRIGGEYLSLLLKHLGPASLLREARQAKPHFLHDPARELYVYKHLLSGLDIGTARLYSGHWPGGGRNGWLLLEKVDGVELWQAGPMTTWEQVARWLARFHALGAPLVAVSRSAPLLRHDSGFFGRWPRRATAFQVGRPLPERAALASLIRRWPLLVERLLSVPRTIVHGDFHPSNVLVAGPRVCPVDWELAAIGPGVLDLAALVSGFDPAERQRLLRAYENAAGPGQWWTGHEELAMAVDAARLYLCVQWLGWAPGWKPPSEHARDWLGEAMTVVEERSW